MYSHPHSRPYTARLLGAVCTLLGASVPLSTALAQPGATHAMTSYDSCGDTMKQTEDLNGDGILDFYCNGYGTSTSTHGFKLVSGKRNTSSELPVLKSNAATLALRFVEARVGATKIVVTCGSVLQALDRVQLTVRAQAALPSTCSDIAAVDIDNNGTDEIVVAQPGLLRFDVFKIQSGIGLSLVSLFGFARTDLPGFGTTVTALNDVNGDGRNDFAIGAPGAAVGRGVVAIMLGDLGGTMPLQLLFGATMASSAGVGGSLLGQALRFLDLNGDGVPELLAGAPGDSAVHWFERSGASFSLTRSLTRAANDGFGSKIGDVALDVNGDNKPDLPVVYSSSADKGVGLVSGRSLKVVRSFAGFDYQPTVLKEQAHHDPDRVYGALALGKYTSLAGSNNNSPRFHVVNADNYGCPVMNVAPAHSASEFAGVFGNDGKVPTITVPKGCAVPGGDIVIDSAMSPNGPALVLAGPEIAAPFPSVMNSANKLTVKRDNLQALEPAVAPASGLVRVVVRDNSATLTDPDGSGPIPAELRWFIQAFQFAQFAPTAQASGNGIASSRGHQLRAVQP